MANNNHVKLDHILNIGADYVGAWGLVPPLENAPGGLSPL